MLQKSMCARTMKLRPRGNGHEKCNAMRGPTPKKTECKIKPSPNIEHHLTKKSGQNKKRGRQKTNLQKIMYGNNTNLGRLKNQYLKNPGHWQIRSALSRIPDSRFYGRCRRLVSRTGPRAGKCPPREPVRGLDVEPSPLAVLFACKFIHVKV